MKKTILTMLTCCILLSLNAQPESSESYRNFPIVVTLHFHALSMPFRNFRTNFRNPGIGIGTEVSLNGDHNWVQQITVVYYRNKAVGNGLLFFTQADWRPTLGSDLYGEVKAGIGYLISFRPVESFKPVDGDWVSAGRRGKGMLVIPAGIALGYNSYSQNTYVSPFIGYQFLLLNKYSKSVPIIPETFIQAGTRIHLK